MKVAIVRYAGIKASLDIRRVAILEDEFGVRHEYFVPADAEKAAGRRPHLNTMPGTHGTPEFIADLAADIYQLHTPNYREGIRIEMDKFTCSDNTRMNWLKKGAKMLKPLVELLKLKLLKVGSFLNIDETWCRIRIKIKGDGTKLGHYFKKYIWILINNDQVTPEIIKKRRECKDVTDTLTTLYSHARKALRQKGKRYSDLMVQALNYMLNGWDELQTYRKDGRYTIDNLPAERAIRPFTVSRKNSLHYSSEEGVEMAMTYLTIIETAKMWGLHDCQAK